MSASILCVRGEGYIVTVSDVDLTGGRIAISLFLVGTAWLASQVSSIAKITAI